MARTLLDVPAVVPDVRASIPRIVRPLVDVTRPRRRNDHLAVRRRGGADFHFDAARLCHTGAREQAEGQCRSCASNPHSLSLTTLSTRLRPRMRSTVPQEGPRPGWPSFGVRSTIHQNQTLSDTAPPAAM